MAFYTFKVGIGKKGAGYFLVEVPGAFDRVREIDAENRNPIRTSCGIRPCAYVEHLAMLPVIASK
jgi:hypothetical protein